MDFKFGRITVLVNDYDEAFEFYEKALSCKKFFDITENGKRFLHLSLNSNDKSGIWFLKAETSEQKERVGNQTAGMPLMVVYTDNIDEINQHLIDQNIKLVRELNENQDSRFLHFNDLYGNEIVVVEMKTEVNS